MKKALMITICIIVLSVFSFGMIPVYAGSSVESNIDRPEIAIMSYKGKLVADWESIDKADKYEVAYKLSSKDSWTKTTVKTTNFSVKAKAGKTYKVKVRAICGNTKGKWSLIRKVKMREGYPGSKSKFIMFGWKGRESQAMWKRTIDLYKSHYNPLSIDSEAKAMEITLNVGKYDSARIIKVAETGDQYEELRRVLELWIMQNYDPETGKLKFDGSWWYGNDNSNNEYAFIVRLKTNGICTYKYFRVNFS